MTRIRNSFFDLKRAIPETRHQQNIISWWRLTHKALGVPDERMLMSIPMQGKRTIQNGRRMKAEGFRAGVPDLFLCAPRGGKAGLWIELKAEKGVVSLAQTEMLTALRAQGYAAVVCYGFDRARQEIEKYLMGEAA